MGSWLDQHSPQVHLGHRNFLVQFTLCDILLDILSISAEYLPLVAKLRNDRKQPKIVFDSLKLIEAEWKLEFHNIIAVELNTQMHMGLAVIGHNLVSYVILAWWRWVIAEKDAWDISESQTYFCFRFFAALFLWRHTRLKWLDHVIWCNDVHVF